MVDKQVSPDFLMSLKRVPSGTRAIASDGRMWQYYKGQWKWINPLVGYIEENKNG